MRSCPEKGQGNIYSRNVMSVERRALDAMTVPATFGPVTCTNKIFGSCYLKEAR